MNTKQLEELKAWIEKAKLDFYDPDGYINTPTIIGMIEHFLASQREEIAIMLERMQTLEKYDNMVCSNCHRFIRERFSHNSEDGFSECCGKKLERIQGEKPESSPENAALVLAAQAVREYGN